MRCGALVFLLLLATGSALAQDSYRPKTPLGLDEYYAVPESNLLTAGKITLGR